MITEYRDNFIHLEFEDEDFRAGEDGRSPQQAFIADLKDKLKDEAHFDGMAKIWLVINTAKNAAIVEVLREHYFGGASTPKKG